MLAVARPPDLGTEIEVEPVIERELKHYESVLAGIAGQLEQSAVKTQSEVVVGHPSEQLLRYAETHGIDHIVVGNRGRTLFERLLLGSIARQVIAHAPCNVTVVRAYRTKPEPPARASARSRASSKPQSAKRSATSLRRAPAAGRAPRPACATIAVRARAAVRCRS